MNDWDDIDDWVEEEIEDLVKQAKDEAGKVFLTSVTSPTNFNVGTEAYGMGGNTPVRSGNLMANTEVGINSEPDGTNSSKDKEGINTFQKGASKIKAAKAWDKIYFVNDTPYNIQAEFSGWVKTKPYRYWELSYNDMLETIK